MSSVIESLPRNAPAQEPLDDGAGGMYWEQKVEYAALSDIGFRRRNNQDAYAVQIVPDRETWHDRGHLFLVADGMGGHAVGELASKIAADTIPHTFYKTLDGPPEEALKSAVLAGNSAIHARGELNRDFTRMGTTCTTLVLCPEGAVVAHVGDSRAYRIRGDRIEQLTFDHSLQWELMRQGRMSAEEIMRSEPRNVITRSLGPAATVPVDVEGPHPIRPQDVYVLCSDGLSSLVKDEEIGVAARELPPAEACRLLVNLANLRGGPDNITVMIVRVGAIPADLPPESTYEPARARLSRFGWLWLIGLVLAAGAFITGRSLAFLGRPLLGFVIEAVGTLGIGGLILTSLRARRRAAERAALPGVTPGTPYRTASARITPAIVTEMANLEDHLQRSALEEGWSIDWSQHGTVFQAGKSALTEKRYPEALRNFAKAIQVLMAGIHQIRRQREQIAKWGPRPSGREEAEPGGA